MEKGKKSQVKKKSKQNTMAIGGIGIQNRWKLPDKDDILVYEREEIVKKILPPMLLNNRGIYSVNVD